MKTVTWYIFNVLGKKKHVSPTFLEAGFEWHIEAYPNGIDDTCKGCVLACCFRPSCNVYLRQLTAVPSVFFRSACSSARFRGFTLCWPKGAAMQHAR